MAKSQNQMDLDRHIALHQKYIDQLVDSVKNPANRATWKLRWMHLPVLPSVRRLFNTSPDVTEMKSVAVSMTGVDEPWAYSLHAAAAINMPWRPIPVPFLVDSVGLTAADVIREPVLDPKVRSVLLSEVTYRCGSRDCNRRHVGHCLSVRVSVPEGEVIANVATVGLEATVSIETMLLSRIEPLDLAL